MRIQWLILSALISAPLLAARPLPVIDMHMHAWSLTEFGSEPPEVCAGAFTILGASSYRSRRDAWIDGFTPMPTRRGREASALTACTMVLPGIAGS